MARKNLNLSELDNLIANEERARFMKSNIERFDNRSSIKSVRKKMGSSLNVGASHLKTEGDIPGLDFPDQQFHTMNNSPRGKFKDYLMKIERNKVVFSNMNSPKQRIELLPKMKMASTSIDWSNMNIKNHMKVKKRRLP